MKHAIVLLIDAAINLILGILLLAFSENMVALLGVPGTSQYFYPNILGGVLIGIAVALVVESFRKPKGFVGLGLGGAIAINLCGGVVLAYWLLFKHLTIPACGRIFLWILVLILVVISSVELMIQLHKK
jgi:hypothetical protein